MIFVELNTVEWVLLSLLGLLFCVQVYWYARYLAAPARRLRKNNKNDQTANAQMVNDLPPVSVILSAHNEAFNLSHYLKALLTQDYPEYEVIVVDDGSEDATRDVVESFMAQDERLRMTFVPYGARVGSTKKLALTLAAIHDCSFLSCIVVKETCNVVHCTSPRPHKTRTLRRWKTSKSPYFIGFFGGRGP